MNTQKGFASILLVLLGLFIGGTGVYFYTQGNKQDNYLLQEKCSLSAKQYFEDLKAEKKGISGSNYKNHYNSKLNKCILVTRFEWEQGGHINVYDVLERKEIMWLVDLIGEPYSCKYLDDNKECDDPAEFNKKVDEYLTN